MEALEREDYDVALRSARECLESDPSDRVCFRAELLGYGRTGDFVNAKLLIEECLFDDPNDIECLSGMVTQHVREGDLENARRLAEKLRLLAPGSVLSFLADAQIAESVGRLDDAIRLYGEACALAQEFACKRAEELRRGRGR